MNPAAIIAVLFYGNDEEQQEIIQFYDKDEVDTINK